MSNKGIGKGLAALLGNMKEEETIAEKSESAVSREIMNVDISLIDTNPYQPRKVFDKAALEELAASIKTFGIIQPLIVLRSGNRYVIIAGERRFRAARLAGLTSVPCVVRELTPREMREIALIENLQREDLNPVEAAEGIAELIKSCDLTQEEAAERIGMSRPVVTNLLRLLSSLPTPKCRYITPTKRATTKCRSGIWNSKSSFISAGNLSRPAQERKNNRRNSKGLSTI